MRKSKSRLHHPKDWVPGEKFLLDKFKREGWEHLPAANAAVDDGALDIKVLWRAAAQKDLGLCEVVLAEAGFDLEGALKDIYIISTPDDLKGEDYLVFVKF